MKSYFAYIRVSTVKQGEHGSSLQEQRDAIDAFALRNALRITQWYEERETAAKLGRREFTRMLAALKKHAADGVIFHKIDRSARNLKDWSVIQDLADAGIDVRFTQESVNLGSNEGKLTGDFLAVISAHYIRNLREEVKKGMRGRLKQGLYPLPAPIGYLNQGGGKPKIPDPVLAPLIRQTFELYARGGFSLRPLANELHRCGLRSRRGATLDANDLSKILRNPFYVGIIRMKGTGECFPGVHKPIVPKSLFDRAQHVLNGKMNAKVISHDFIFRRMIVCTTCRYRLIGERQKGNVYYRCHQCPGSCIREATIETELVRRFIPLHLTSDEQAEIHGLASSLAGTETQLKEDVLQSLRLQLENAHSRMARLMDAFLDQAVELPLFNEKKLSLLLERKSLEEKIANLEANSTGFVEEALENLELGNSLLQNYRLAKPDEKRELVKTVTSNFSVCGKNVVVELHSPFQEIANLTYVSNGGPVRDKPRSRAREIFDLLVTYFTAKRPPLDQKDGRVTGRGSIIPPRGL